MMKIRFSFDSDDIDNDESTAEQQVEEDNTFGQADEDYSDMDDDTEYDNEPEDEYYEDAADDFSEEAFNNEESHNDGIIQSKKAENHNKKSVKNKKEINKKNTDSLKKNKLNKRGKKDTLKKIALAIVIFAASGAVILASPVFAVNNIEVNELKYFTKDEICTKIGLSQGDNGVFFNKGKAEKKLEEDKYIYSAEISFKLPDTMVITVDENRIYGYIPYLGSYLYINREGRVIDIKNETEEKLPVIEGLEFGYFTQGEIIPVENSEAFNTALIISRAMSKYEMLDKKISINVSDSENIYAYIDNIKVLLGDTTRMEEKIKTMSEAVKEIPDGDRGTLDLRDLSKPIIFKYST